MAGRNAKCYRHCGRRRDGSLQNPTRSSRACKAVMVLLWSLGQTTENLLLQEGGRDAGPCLTEWKNKSPGQRRASKAIEFIEGKYKALKSERGPDQVAAEDFCT